MVQDKLQQNDSWAARVLDSFKWCAPLVASKSGTTKTAVAVHELPEAPAQENDTAESCSSVDTRPGGYIGGELQDIVSDEQTLTCIRQH